MRVDLCISAIDEEAKLAKTATVADKFVDICMCFRISCALECKVCKMSAKSSLYSSCQSFNSLMLHKVYRYRCAHSLCKFKTLLISVYCTDIFDTHSTKNCDTDQTDWSASLNNNSAVEFQDTCCFCSLYCMDQNCTWLDEDTGIQIQITYVKESGTEFSASDKDVVSKPTIEFYIIIRKKSIYICAAYVFLIQVKHCDLRIILEDHTGNNLVTNLNRFAGCINLYVFTHCNDLTCSLMSKDYRDQTKRIVFVFMSICSADTASLNLNKDVVISKFRKRILLKFKVFFLGHHCNSCSFRNSTVCCWSSRSRSSCRSFSFSCHAGKNLFYNFFNIYIVHIHCSIPPD